MQVGHPQRCKEALYVRMSAYDGMSDSGLRKRSRVGFFAYGVLEYWSTGVLK